LPLAAIAAPVIAVAPAPPTDNAAGISGLNTAPTSHKPAAVTILGQRIVVKSWANMLVAICGVLAKQNSSTFAAVACATQGKKRAYVAASPDGMIAPKPIPGTPLYVETNLSALNILRVAHLLLGKLGYSPADLSVEFAE
jgi:hypothetical protein